MQSNAFQWQGFICQIPRLDPHYPRPPGVKTQSRAMDLRLSNTVRHVTLVFCPCDRGWRLTHQDNDLEGDFVRHCLSEVLTSYRFVG